MRIVPLAHLTARTVPAHAGRAGVLHTLRAMRRCVVAGKVDPAIRAAAINIVQFDGDKDYFNEARSLFEHVRDSIRYVRDVHGIETVASARRTLEIEAGDCDDQTVLLAALLESIGFATRFIATGYRSPETFEHVYMQVRVGNRWINCDPTEPQPFGWAPPNPRAVIYERL